MEPLLLTIPQAAEALAIGRTSVYALLNVGDLAFVKVGRCTRIPVSSVREYTERLLERW